MRAHLLLGLLGLGLSGTVGAIQVTVPVRAQVESVCVVERLAGPALILKCTRGTQAPLDPRGLAGVPSRAWRLEDRGRGVDGAEVFRYRALSGSGASAEVPSTEAYGTELYRTEFY